MRIIKFRAWDDGKKEWLLGYEYPSLGGFSLDGECVLMGEWANVCTSFMFENDNRKRTDLKLMQFTGLQDKNGKDIYEGDILKSKVELEGGTESIRKVVYGEGGFDMEKIEKDGKVDSMYLKKYWKYSLQVIGNIYENPELLSTPIDVI
jgi:uncharacterized phage protein (TIGR01671 family)